MDRDEPYEIAKDLRELVDGVRACRKRITVAVAPEEKNVMELSLTQYMAIMEVIEETMYQHEYSKADRSTVEMHRYGHGRSNPILPGYDMPADYELQMSFVR